MHEEVTGMQNPQVSLYSLQLLSCFTYSEIWNLILPWWWCNSSRSFKSHFWTLKLQLSNSNIPQTLSTATHVFVHHDAVRKPLQPPYDGPYPVIKRTSKHFTLNINGKNDTVSIDRHKPPHVDSEHPTHSPPLVQLQQMHTTTHQPSNTIYCYHSSTTPIPTLCNSDPSIS